MIIAGNVADNDSKALNHQNRSPRAVIRYAAGWKLRFLHSLRDIEELLIERDGHR